MEEMIREVYRLPSAVYRFFLIRTVVGRR